MSTAAGDAIKQQKIFDLKYIEFLLQRMKRNLQLVQNPNNPKVIWASNTTLFKIAENEYGDASLWLAISKINQLDDPKITTPVQIMIPPLSQARNLS